MTESATTPGALWAPVVGATATLAWIVPELPLAHLDDPSHWGILGYLGFVALLLRRSRLGRPGLPKRLVALFLLSMPVVYLANWVRFGGSGGWLGLELAGLAFFGLLAWRGAFHEARWLVVGVALHAVWDAAHLGGPSFVPDWYATGCAVVDVGVAGYVAGLWVTGRTGRTSP